MNQRKRFEVTHNKGNYISLTDVYLYIYNEENLSCVIFDDEYIYTFYDFVINSLDLNKFEYLDKEYTSIMGNESGIPSHYYEKTLKNFDFLMDREYKNVLVYDTNNLFYNNLNYFMYKHIFKKNLSYTKIKSKQLYKIKKLNAGILTHSVILKEGSYENKIRRFNLVLNEIIPVKEMKKYYNLKLKNNITNCCTQTRCFINSDIITDILQNNNYIELNKENEYEKQIQLRNSQYLILSWGGNHYINAVFSLYNCNKPILILCHHSYKHEYETLYGYSYNKNIDTNLYGNKIRFVFDIEDELTNLNELINDFETHYYNDIHYTEQNHDNFNENMYKRFNYDLNHIKDSELENHYKTIGKKEKRIHRIELLETFNIDNFKLYNPMYLNVYSDEEIKIHCTKWINTLFKRGWDIIPDDFVSKNYIELNHDLKHMTEIEAIYHYVCHGYKENRKYKYENIPEDFVSKDYIELNQDLQHMNELEAKIHYEYNGYKENRKYANLLNY
jgi:hypothetical protein